MSSLYVAVKPEYVKVFKEDDNAEISSSALIGPFQEGQELKLSCKSGGGKPIPDITWWNGTHKLPGEYNPITVQSRAQCVISVRPACSLD
jgi:CD80-like C2-set immunoglobulin domain